MWIHSVALNTLSAILVAAILYILACLVDMQVIPLTETVKNVYVTDTRSNIKDVFHDKAINIKVKRGDIVNFDVRYYTTHNAQVQAKRYLVGANGIQRELSEFKFHIHAGEVKDVVVYYAIPLSAPLGCGYTLYSRLEVVYPYNILTRISPIGKNITRGASFCIEE